MKMLITGANGLLGKAFVAHLDPKKTVALTKDQLDITCYVDCLKTIVKHSPEVVINCGAFTDVDKAEVLFNLAYKINSEGVKNLALVCKELGIPLIHFSTDYVFDGVKGGPYVETDETNPLSIYGKSKLAGEINLKSIWHKHYIIRTGWLYDKTGENFATWILNSRNKKMSIINDQYGSPTYAPDLVKCALGLIGTPYGTYHISGEGITTWFEWARLLNTRNDLTPVSYRDLPRPAPRPNYSVLNNRKFNRATGMSMPHWEFNLPHLV